MSQNNASSTTLASPALHGRSGPEPADDPSLVQLAGFTRDQVWDLIEKYAADNKRRAAESNRREFLSRQQGSVRGNSSSAAAPVKLDQGIVRYDRRPASASASASASSQPVVAREKPIRSETASARSSRAGTPDPSSSLGTINDDDDNDSLSDPDDYFPRPPPPDPKATDPRGPSTCARTSLASIDRSTQMRRHVVWNPEDDILARSTIPRANRKGPFADLTHVPEAMLERVGNLWKFLNFVFDQPASTITVNERLKLIHDRLLILEHGYAAWYLTNKFHLHPSHLIANVTDLVNADVDANASLFVIAQGPRGQSFGISAAIYHDMCARGLDRTGDPVPHTIWLKHTMAALAACEERLMRIERLAPLWFALNCQYEGRPDELPACVECRVRRAGMRWYFVVVDPGVDVNGHSGVLGRSSY
ncbi:hypothetical protein BCR44DRAFT_66379 [Catenaria anguillulae PL171]|uniref:Uncharacterized protein n=1 Tax=Catenaria anguillulae PL171 TaxID=765915 RepID=A0A1Y2HU37_9FUNG|nr:hypothetical protein BCR44DRAFT_66379 [Catenaria anguillulae PL171]